MFYSCGQIREGFNFYRSGKITACCNQISPELEIAHIDDNSLPDKILLNQNRLIMRHKNGDPPEACKRCANFVPNDWSSHLVAPFTKIIFNHFKKCNLRCVHCGYRHQDEKEKDTPHEAVFKIVKDMVSSGICQERPMLEIGGGEPSLADGLMPMLEYGLKMKWTAIVNSNGARYSELFASGVNSGQLTLLLTPDAGTRQVYTEIKGVDNFLPTWRNIGRYMAATNRKAYVKFILEKGNHDDIAAMIQTSREYGVKNLILSLDMNIRKSEYPFYIEKAKEFFRLSNRAGLNVIRGAFLPAF